MMRPAPVSLAAYSGSAVTTRPNPPPPAAAAPSGRPATSEPAGASSLMLRRTDADAPAPEAADDSGLAMRPISEPRAQGAAGGGVSHDRRAASLFGPMEPVASAAARRRKQSPDEFRERCGADGGSVQGGGKYGLCIIR